MVSTVGTRLPSTRPGSAKVLLARAADDVRETALADLVRVTPYTITLPVRLRRQLERVCQEGYAATADEMTLGARSIAVPVRAAATGSSSHPDGAVVAALGVVVPILRRDRSRLLAALQVGAQGIGRSLEATRPSA